jgi:hypothetical protein
MKNVLGVEPRSLRDTVVEMAYACIENDLILKTPQYHGPKGEDERAMYQEASIFH